MTRTRWTCRGYVRLAATAAVLLVMSGLGYYDRRDGFKHWITKQQRANQPFTHACCRGMRAHPEHYPVNPPAATYAARPTGN
jgi:hypothetical protein